MGSIVYKKHCFKAKANQSWEGAIQHKEFIIYNFITLDLISNGTTIIEYCKIAYAPNMFIWTKFMTPHQNFVLPLSALFGVGMEWSGVGGDKKYRYIRNLPKRNILCLPVTFMLK